MTLLSLVSTDCGWPAMVLCVVSCGWYVARGTVALGRMVATAERSLWLTVVVVVAPAIAVARSREVSGPHYGRTGALTAAASDDDWVSPFSRGFSRRDALMEGGERVGNRVNDPPRDRACSRESSPWPSGWRALDRSAAMSLSFRKPCPPSQPDILHQFRILLLRHELLPQRSYSSVLHGPNPRCASD